MKAEDKKLLIKDLCARLPYHVIVKYKDANVDLTKYVRSVKIEECKPYLKPMSSMTKEEFLYFMSIRGMNLKSHEIQEMMSKYFSHPDSMAIVNRLGRYSHNIDWLNENMFDYRGLIPKGLALEAPEGMYIHLKT